MMARASDFELERRIQERLWTQIANKTERRMRDDLAKIARAVGDAYSRGASIDSAIASQDAELENALVRMWRPAYETVGKRSYRVIGEATGKRFYFSGRKNDEEMSEAFRRGLERYIQKYGSKKITQINSGTQTIVNEIIKEGIEEGLKVDEIGALIAKEGVRRSVYRAHLISRTETHSAANAGSIEAARDTEVVEEKEWIPVGDGRTRTADNSDFDHVNVANVRINRPFIVSGEELDFPGDPAGSAGNIIMCRCAIGWVV